MDNQALAERMKVILATAYSFALKAQNYHWNVAGPNFFEYHEFFQDIYEQVHRDVDVYAEQIRVLGMFAPGSLSRFSELSRIQDELNIPTTSKMIFNLLGDNVTMVAMLKTVHAAAEEAKNPGLAAVLEERILYHEKLGWMLDSLLQ
jgi:starvation-inducible DNA-binding protein